MGFGVCLCVIVACDVLVRNAGVVGDTVFGFQRALYVGVQFCIFVSCCYLWFDVFIGSSSSLVVACFGVSYHYPLVR